MLVTATFFLERETGWIKLGSLGRERDQLFTVTFDRFKFFIMLI